MAEDLNLTVRIYFLSNCGMSRQEDAEVTEVAEVAEVEVEKPTEVVEAPDKDLQMCCACGAARCHNSHFRFWWFILVLLIFPGC